MSEKSISKTKQKKLNIRIVFEYTETVFEWQKQTNRASLVLSLCESTFTSRTVRNRVRPLSPWFDAECRAARRNCRRLERGYRRTKCDDDRSTWVAAVRKKHVDFAFKKDRYWTARIALKNHNPSKLWRLLAKILRRDKDTGATSAPDVHSADAFLSLFNDIVRSVQSSTHGRPPADVQVVTSALLSRLQTCVEDDVRRVIIESPT